MPGFLDSLGKSVTLRSYAEDWLKCVVLPQALNLLQPTHSQFTTWLHLGKLFYFAQGEEEETQKT